MAKKSTPTSTLIETNERPNVTWDNIGGLDNVKKELQERLLPFRVEHDEKRMKFSMKSDGGVLLYGPPGCGKTLLANAVAHECHVNFISRKGPELLTMSYAELEANIRDVFDMARSVSPCVLFFDDLDLIAKTKDGDDNDATDRIFNLILAELDGICYDNNVFIFAATSKPDTIDPAMLAPGRFDQLIYVPLPADEQSRIQIMTAQLRNTPLSMNVDIPFLAKSTDGFSGADLTEICQRACKVAIRESIENDIALEKTRLQAINRHEQDDYNGDDSLPEITHEHFQQTLAVSRWSISDSEIQKYELFSQQRGFGSSFRFPSKADGAPFRGDEG